MTLNSKNLLNNSNPIYSFEQQQFQDPDELLLPSEAELLCFEPIAPTLFPIDDPLFNPPPSKLDHKLRHLDHHDLIAPKTDPTPYTYLDLPPPLLLPVEENLPFEEDYLYSHPQLLPFPKRHNFPIPYLSGLVPEFVCFSECGFVERELRKENEVMGAENKNPGYGDGGSTNGNKGRSVSAQSKAARERRRKITDKTQKLGKLVPGGTKMNTAEMLQAAFKYVKFLQAQLGILQSMNQFQKGNDKKDGSNSLQILASQVVQEKLYTKEKCLVPIELVPTIEEHYDLDNNTF